MSQPTDQTSGYYKTYNENNPYSFAKGRDSMSISGWQKFLDNLGITNYAEQMDRQQTIRAEEWESNWNIENESATAARQRAAGYNPDFQNAPSVDGTAGDAGSPDIMAAQQSANESFENTIKGIGSLAMEAFTAGMAIDNQMFQQDLQLCQRTL